VRHRFPSFAACWLIACAPQPVTPESNSVQQEQAAADPEPAQRPPSEEPVELDSASEADPPAADSAVNSDPVPELVAPSVEPAINLVTVQNDPAQPADGDCSAELNRALMARAIVEREPDGTAGPFEANGESLYLFAEFHNGTAGDREYTFRWHHDGTETPFTQTMAVGVSPRWRTWARHRIAESQTGDWRVEVVSPEGCVAGTVAFRAE
jgi:hypothetical protein